jgi:putative NADPH-quinone reductase
MRHVVIIQGHPDPAGGHPCSALTDAHAQGAIAAGHGVHRIDMVRIDVPALRNKADFESGEVPASLKPARDAIVASEHIVMAFPLWLGAMPEKLLSGRSAHMIVAMGMPAALYRWFYSAHGVAGLDRNILRFVGISPVRKTYLGLAEGADGSKYDAWFEPMRAAGRRLQ